MKFKDETWRAVVGYEGLYEVSDWGNVRTLNYKRTGKTKLLRPRIRRDGYLDVMLCKNGKKKMFLVHRLVYAAFRGDIPAGMTIDHVNGIKTDNRLSNLQLLTQGDNTRKANNKQLDLMLAEWPYTELTFENSLKASEFFSYKSELQIGALIAHARKRGVNYINVRKKKYLFAQEA